MGASLTVFDCYLTDCQMLSAGETFSQDFEVSHKYRKKKITNT